MNDPNKLAWKGTPGPWQVEKNAISYEIRQHPTGPHDLCLLVGMGGIRDNQHADRNKANAHFMAAAPEAIDFIADLMETIDGVNKLLKTDLFLSEYVKRAEDILKKAYNF